MTSRNQTLHEKLDALQPGQSVTISASEGVWCDAERSGDGQTLRFVRHYAAIKGVQNERWEVFGEFRYAEFV